MIELVKNNNAITLEKDISNVELKSTVLKGDKGGYYIPSVDNKGILSWTPTEEEMPQIENANLISVTSVNGSTGDVVLDAASVGALPEDTHIPSIEGLASEIYVDDKVSAEATARADADLALQNKIDGLDTAYKAADLALDEKIYNLDNAYKDADLAIEEKITNIKKEYNAADLALQNSLNDIVTQNNTSIANIQENINTISEEYKEADKTLQQNIEDEIARASSAENTNALAITNLQNEDNKINSRIDAEVTAREETHAQIKEECKAENDSIKILIGEETTRALEAESALNSAITDLDTANEEAHTKINNSIQEEKEAVLKVVEDTKTELTTADNDLRVMVRNEYTRAVNAETNLQKAIDAETANRDKAIQDAIDLIPEVDLTPYAKTSYVDEKVASIVDTAPEALNTLNELSAALGDDPNFATTVSTEIGKKVDKVEGKALSSNDFTNAYKNKLDGIAENANNYIHPDTHSANMITGLASVATSGDYKDLKNTPEEYTHPSTHPVSMITGLADVATSGSYNDLTNKPTIPAAYTHPSTHPATMITGLATVATSGSYNDLTNKPTIPSAYTHPTSHPASMITGLAIVATSGKYSDLSGKPTILEASNKGYGGAITAGTDGVAEMGKYIDFHSTSNGTSDYSTRFVCNGENANTVNLPTANGTLTVGDKAYKIVVSSTAPTVNDTSIITILI